jgi:ABC-type Fe3+/spermidine/putrescine transport system ATPase subunit
MNSGQIEQVGTPVEIYTDPASLFVARFLEMTNIIPANIQLQDGKRMLTSPIGNFSVNSSMLGEVKILVRPDMARLDDKGPLVLQGDISAISFRGSRQRATIIVNNIPLIFEFPFSMVLPELGKETTISLTPGSAVKIYSDQ